MESQFYIRTLEIFLMYFLICYTVLCSVLTKLYFYSSQPWRAMTSLRSWLTYSQTQ